MEEKNIIFFLRMLHEFENNNIPLSVFTEQDKDYLIANDYVHLVDGSYILTEKGLLMTYKDPQVIVKVQYPLMVKGRVKSYNKVIKSMSDNAANALICAIMKEDFMRKINTSNTRVFVQHLLDTKNHHKWGMDLLQKYNFETKKSIKWLLNKKDVQHKSRDGSTS